MKTLPGLLLFAALSSAASLARGTDAPPLAVRVCTACHGVTGNGDDPLYPKLAGMNQEYLLRQLKAFVSGRRKNEAMAGLLDNLDAGELAHLARYYESQPVAAGRVRDAGLVPAGRQIYVDGNTDSGIPACAGCHQPGGGGNARFPRLAGQHQAYVIKQLRDYKSGRRATDPLMTTVGQRLTESEIQAVAEYIASL
jgi:cytochrome c553